MGHLKLDPGVDIQNDDGRCDLAGGAGRCRKHDVGRKRFGAVPEGGLLSQGHEIIGAVADQDVDGFGGIHHAAAADHDHAVGAFVAVKRSAFIDQVNPGILNNIIENSHQLKAGFYHGIRHHLRNAGIHHAFVCDDHGPGSAELRHFKAQLGANAGTIHDSGPVGPGKKRIQFNIRVFHKRSPYNEVLIDGILPAKNRALNLILVMNCILVVIMHSRHSQDKLIC